MTTVSQLMTRGVRSMRPSDNVMAAAQAMEELNVGAIPVCDGDKLIGMVTDRDIIVRGVAQNRDAKTTRLADVMSTQVRTVHENDNVDKILREMGSSQVRRLPVVDAQEHLIGIVSLGDIAVKYTVGKDDVAMSLGDISSPAEPNRSGQSPASGAAGGGGGVGKPHRQSS
jgi:CBS domain-containing protein